MMIIYNIPPAQIFNKKKIITILDESVINGAWIYERKKSTNQLLLIWLSSSARKRCQDNAAREACEEHETTIFITWSIPYRYSYNSLNLRLIMAIQWTTLWKIHSNCKQKSQYWFKIICIFLFLTALIAVYSPVDILIKLSTIYLI